MSTSGRTRYLRPIASSSPIRSPYVDELEQDVVAQQLREADVEYDQRIVVADHQVAGVQIGVDEAVLEAHLEHRRAQGLGERGLARAGHRRRQLVDLGAADELHGQHALAGQLGDHRREHHPGPAGEVIAEPLVVRRLDPQIGLRVDRLDELAGVADRIVGARLRQHRPQPRQAEQDRLVALDLPPDPGRSTLTATSRPSRSRPRWTWATLAAATGISSSSANSSAIGRPRSASIVARARRYENAGSRSCSPAPDRQCDRESDGPIHEPARDDDQQEPDQVQGVAGPAEHGRDGTHRPCRDAHVAVGLRMSPRLRALTTGPGFAK
jgi:hypothetical protein